jgi:hypothetical protein
MTRPTADDLEVRHRELEGQASILRESAASIGIEPPQVVRAKVDAAYAFLAEKFLPNARLEQTLREQHARRDYVQVERDRVTAEVESHMPRLAELKHSASDASQRELRAVLGEIAALVELHFKT